MALDHDGLMVISAWNICQDLLPERVWEASYQIPAKAFFFSRRSPAGVGRVMGEASGWSRKMHEAIYATPG